MNFFIAVLIIPVVLGTKHDCPGGSFQCDDSATCCQLLDKSYGCCPLKNAVCCDDHIHCCPANSKCASGMCIQQDFNATRNLKGYLIKTNNVTCPGGRFICPDDTTCCEGAEPGTYGCCPMEDAVCCEDKQHCCPPDTTCDLESQTCNGNGFITKMYDSKKKLFKSHIPKTEQIIHIEPIDGSSVICPGSTFECPDGYSCCKLNTGDWGCCPFAKATCCKDGLHCCPENMVCDETSTHCSQGLNNITSSLNTPAIAISTENIICPDKTSCLDTMTCCLMADSKFGCCQYQNATCCTDKSHCCPSGYDCDLKHKHCVPQTNRLLNSIL